MSPSVRPEVISGGGGGGGGVGYVGLEVLDTVSGNSLSVDQTGTTFTPTIAVGPTDPITFEQPAGTALVSGTRVDLYYGEYGQPGTYVATAFANASGTWAITGYTPVNGARYFVVVNNAIYSDGIRISFASQNVNYEVFYTSLNTPVYQVQSISFSRNVHPRDDTATLSIAGIPTFIINGQTQYGITAAREIWIFRIGSDGSKVLKFRGMTTDVDYQIDSSGGIITNVQVSGLWYMLEIRLLAINGAAPPPFPPNTNPYLLYLNPLLNLSFGTLFKLIVQSGFQTAYSTGQLPPIKPVTSGSFLDNIVVNDQMYMQYVSIASAIDRLITSAIFGTTSTSSEATEPFVGEVFLNIDPNGDNSGTGIPELNVVSFDPLNSIGLGSAFGVGQNKTGIAIPVGSTDPSAQPVDNINLIEGGNIVSWDFAYSYTGMGNSWVLTGASFRGSDVAALPIDNPQSIAKYGLKQISKSLGNVVDPDEIKRYIGQYKAFFQSPIPTMQIKPEWTYADSHTVNPGDFITIVSDTLTNGGKGGVLFDNNGNQIQSRGFITRVKTVNITWDTDNGEDITYITMFPVEANPKFLYNQFSFTAPQYMYSSARPTAETLLGNQTRSSMDSQYNTDSAAPLVNKTSSLSFHCQDHTFTSGNQTFVAPGYDSQSILVESQIMTIQTSGSAQDALIYGMWLTLSANDPSIPAAHVRVLQPDGLAIYDDLLPTNQQINVVSMISKTRNSSNLLVNSVSGIYTIVISNASSDMPAAEQSSNFTPTASTVDYVLQVDLAYLANPSNTKIQSSITAQPNTAVSFDPTKQWVTPT